MSRHEAVLDADERRLLSALREIPPGDLRTSFVALIADMAHAVVEPHCPEMQADGVPCATAVEQCERCRRAAPLLDRLRVASTR
jgi:hypothetical protein